MSEKSRREMSDRDIEDLLEEFSFWIDEAEFLEEDEEDENAESEEKSTLDDGLQKESSDILETLQDGKKKKLRHNKHRSK